MASLLDLGAYSATQASRVAWYLGHRLVARRLGRDVAPPPQPRDTDLPRRPAPEFRELLADVAALFARDGANVAAGLYPAPRDGDGGWPARIARLRAFLADVRPAGERRAGTERTPVAALADAAGLPAYYLEDFHYQDGGYLTEKSARLYDTQVETLFLGAAAAMRRQALVPLVRHFRARDQRGARIVDIGCGTGRFIAEAKRALPAAAMVGIDLSRPYLAEARRHLGHRRGVTLALAPGEALPLADASIDAATAIFLFHELPRDVRRALAAETARVLRPGGLFVLLDSLQTGDRPGWDGLLDGFERSFHEPYYRDYLEDDLGECFADAGLMLTASWTAYLSKVMVFEKP